MVSLTVSHTMPTGAGVSLGLCESLMGVSAHGASHNRGHHWGLGSDDGGSHWSRVIPLMYHGCLAGVSLGLTLAPPVSHMGLTGSHRGLADVSHGSRQGLTWDSSGSHLDVTWVSLDLTGSHRVSSVFPGVSPRSHLVSPEFRMGLTGSHGVSPASHLGLAGISPSLAESHRVSPGSHRVSPGSHLGLT